MSGRTAGRRPADALSRTLIVWVGGIGLAAALAVVHFDLATTLSANDDWIYAWSVGQLVAGHGVRIPPEQAAIGLVQVFWAAIFAAGHTDIRLLRLSVIPFAALAVVSCHRISRQLGAGHAWSLVGALTLGTQPMFLALTATFMTDIVYLGLLMAATAAAVRWVTAGKAIGACVLFTVLAVLQRQVGAGVVLALTVGLMRKRSERPVSMVEWRWLCALWIFVAVALVGPLRLISTPTQSVMAGQLTLDDVVGLLLVLLTMAPIMGLLLLPLVVPLANALPRTSGGRGTLGSALLGIVIVGLAVGLWRAYPVGFLLGDYVTVRGLGPPHLLGDKPPLLPAVVYVPLELAVLLTSGLLVASALALTRQRRVAGATAVLLLVALSQLVVPVHVGLLDRYFLPVAALLIPLITAAADRRAGTTTRLTVIGICAAGVLGFVAGEQDYQAWQGARSLATRRAQQLFTPDRINAGYEANGVYFSLPYFERTGRLWAPIPRRAADAPSLRGPDHACLLLSFARAGDPRPGFDYLSLAPGRVVLEPTDWALDAGAASCRSASLGAATP